MRSRTSSLMVGSLALALTAGAFGAVLAYQKFAGTQARSPLRVIFEGSASGLKKGGGVNFGGVRVGEVLSLKLDNPRRVVALAMVDNSAPIRKDTLVGLEFQGLTGVAAISLTGGSVEAPPVPLDVDGVPILTADPDSLLDTQEKIRVALRNVDRIIADNQADLKDTLLNLETFTAVLASSGEGIDSVMSSAEAGVGAVDKNLTKTSAFLASLASAKSGGELLPTVISFRELVESFNKRSGALMSDVRRTLSDVSQSINKVDPKAGGPGRRR